GPCYGLVRSHRTTGRLSERFCQHDGESAVDKCEVDGVTRRSQSGDRSHVMGRDILLYGLSQSVDAAALLQWAQTTPGLHAFPAPDFHRLQLEHWIWSNRAALGHQILDVGVYNPRRYLGEGYITFGENGEDTKGDLLALPFPDGVFDG